MAKIKLIVSYTRDQTINQKTKKNSIHCSQ